MLIAVGNLVGCLVVAVIGNSMFAVCSNWAVGNHVNRRKSLSVYLAIHPFYPRTDVQSVFRYHVDCCRHWSAMW